MRIVLMYSTHRPSAEHVNQLRACERVAEVIVAQDESHAMKACEEAGIILGHRYLQQVLPQTKRLGFVQTTAGGVDRLPLKELADLRVRFCRCTIASQTIARHAVTTAWAIARALPAAWSRQQHKQWAAELDWPPHPQRALVVGTGAIGVEIARLLTNDGIHVVGVRSSSSSLAVEGFKEIHSQEMLPDLLPDADWCFLALPATEQTSGMFDESMLSRLKTSATLINVARGELIDTVALCRLMLAGHLSGASLDVLSADAKHPSHPVWSTPRLMITPHVAAHSAERPAQLEAFMLKQVQAYFGDAPLDNEVDLSPYRSRDVTDQHHRSAV